MLVSLALIFIMGLSLGAIFKKIKLPPLIGMLLTGIILGPFVLNLISADILNISSSLRQIALIIIMIRAGLSLDISSLKKLGLPAILLCFLPSLFEMSGTILLAMFLLNMEVLDAAILASILASASPAVLVPRMISYIEEGYGSEKSLPQLLLASESIDDILNVVILSALMSIAVGENFNLGSTLFNIPLSLIYALAFGTAIGLILVTFFKKYHMRDSIKVIIIISIAFLFVALENDSNIIPFSGLLAVMSLGIIILQTYEVLATRLSKKFSKLWVAAEIVLFVLVGASVNINYVDKAGLNAVILIFGIFLFRALGILISIIPTNFNGKEKFFCVLTGIPKATMQAALGGIPLMAGLESGEIILAVSVLTILITAPLGAIALDLSHKKLLKKSTSTAK